MLIPSKAVIPDKVFVICNKNDFAVGAAVSVRLASYYQKKKPSGAVFVVDNLFKGPAAIDRIVTVTNSFGIDLLVSDLFPFSAQVDARCWLTEWAAKSLILSGEIKKGGAISKDVEFCAVTYGAHYSMVIKDSELYNSIPKTP